MILFWISAIICAGIYINCKLRFLGLLPDTDEAYMLARGAFVWALFFFLIGVIVVLV